MRGKSTLCSGPPCSPFRGSNPPLKEHLQNKKGHTNLLITQQLHIYWSTMNGQFDHLLWITSVKVMSHSERKLLQSRSYSRDRKTHLLSGPPDDRNATGSSSSKFVLHNLKWLTKETIVVVIAMTCFQYHMVILKQRYRFFQKKVTMMSQTSWSRSLKRDFRGLSLCKWNKDHFQIFQTFFLHLIAVVLHLVRMLFNWSQTQLRVSTVAQHPLTPSHKKH